MVPPHPTGHERKKVVDSIPYGWYSVLNEDIVMIVSVFPEFFYGFHRIARKHCPESVLHETKKPFGG
jgi:hypothetical protein